MERALVVVSIFIFSLVLPWWVFMIGVAVASFRFPSFVEGVVVAALYDMTYATHELFGVRFFITALAVMFCFGMSFIRRYIRYDAFSS